MEHAPQPERNDAQDDSDSTATAIEDTFSGRFGIWRSTTGRWWAARRHALTAAETSAGCQPFIHADDPETLTRRIQEQENLRPPPPPGRGFLAAPPCTQQNAEAPAQAGQGVCETAAPPPTWSRAFPATPDQAREARRFLAAILNGRPAAEDAVLCLSELAANATIHSKSRMPGGYFSVRVQLHGSQLRVETHDNGGPWTWPEHPSEQHGRGLLILSKLARAWGRSGDSDTGWTVWFELLMTAHTPASQSPVPEGSGRD